MKLDVVYVGYEVDGKEIEKKFKDLDDAHTHLIEHEDYDDKETREEFIKSISVACEYSDGRSINSASLEAPDQADEEFDFEELCNRVSYEPEEPSTRVRNRSRRKI